MAAGRADGQRAEIGPPNRFISEMLPHPPEITPEQQAKREEMMNRDHLRPPVRDHNQPVDIVGPAANTETDPPVDAPVIPLTQPPHGNRPVAEMMAARPPGALVSFLGTTVVPLGQGGIAVNEPCVAHGGKHVFYTGNYYAARSADGGLTWSFIDPSADMPDFCCDQDVIYDRARDLFLWYRQGSFDPNTGMNRCFLSASTDGGASWCTYILRAADLNPVWTTNQAFDYPRLALSNNYVYLITGTRGTGIPTTIVLRLPLDSLATCSAIGSTWWWGQLSYWAGPVEGATTAMYFGDHQGSSSSFRIYQQKESDAGITWHDVSISGWLLEQGELPGACPAKDGQNWCVRSDSLVRGGWVANGKVGFLWHARAGNGFPFPYIEAATFNEQNGFAYIGRPAIWSTTGAWHYPFVSPNARGDLAFTAFYSDSASYPSPYFGVKDDFTPPARSWDVYRLLSGTAGAVGWGDYVRNRAFQPSQLGWVTSAWIVQADQGAGPQVVPLFYILARERDIPSIGKYWQA